MTVESEQWRGVSGRNFVGFIAVLGFSVICGLAVLSDKEITKLTSTPIPMEPGATYFLPDSNAVILPNDNNFGFEAQDNLESNLDGSCIYSMPWINDVATPIPHGGHSEFMGYRCEYGYWDIGVGDWIDGSGNWGSDGVKEVAHIKYNKDGMIADRKFFNLQGTPVPGPTK